MTIRIIVAGLAASGKSTIINEIVKALKRAGIDVVMKDVDRLDCTIGEQDRQEFRLGRLAGRRTVVQIEERNMYHSLMNPGETEIAGLREFTPVKIKPRRRKPGSLRRGDRVSPTEAHPTLKLTKRSKGKIVSIEGTDVEVQFPHKKFSTIMQKSELRRVK